MRYCFIIFLISFFHIAYGQTSTFNNQGLDMQAVQGGFISQLKPVEKKSTGSAYIYDDYKLATIHFLNDDVAELPVNINVSTGNVEILFDEQIKIGSNKVIKFVEVSNGSSLDIYSFENVSLPDNNFSGIVSKVYTGNNFKVLKLYSFYVKEGYYVPALDVGDNKINYIIKESIAVVKSDNDGSLNFTVATTSKRRFSKAFSNSDEVLVYIKDNNLDLGNHNDLISVFEFIDSNL